MEAPQEKTLDDGRAEFLCLHRQDSDAAFTAVWQQYRDVQYPCCVRWMGRLTTEAEDALSRAMLKAWGKVLLSDAHPKLVGMDGEEIPLPDPLYQVLSQSATLAATRSQQGPHARAARTGHRTATHGYGSKVRKKPTKIV